MLPAAMLKTLVFPETEPAWHFMACAAFMARKTAITTNKMDNDFLLNYVSSCRCKRRPAFIRGQCPARRPADAGFCAGAMDFRSNTSCQPDCASCFHYYNRIKKTVARMENLPEAHPKNFRRGMPRTA